MALTLQQILACNDCKPVKHHVPEWGGDVYLIPPTGALLDKYEQWKIENPKLPNHRAYLVAMCLCDEQGDRLAPDLADIHELSKRNGAVLDRLAGEAWRMSRMSQSDVAETVGNSDAGPSAGDGSS